MKHPLSTRSGSSITHKFISFRRCFRSVLQALADLPNSEMLVQWLKKE